MYLELHTATPHATVLFTVDGSDPKPSKVQSPKLVATGETSLSDSFSGVYSGISEKKIESQSREQVIPLQRIERSSSASFLDPPSFK